MAEPAKKSIPQSEMKKKGDIKNNSLSIMENRQAKDIYFGLCGYVGCGMKTVNEIIEEVAKDWEYNVVHIRISALLDNPLYFEKAAIDSARDSNPNRHLKLQALANNLRRYYKRNELLAEAAIAAIAAEKKKIDYTKEDYKGTIFIVDQFKRPEEVELFRVIYQHNFYLVGILRDQDHRITNLIADESAKEDLHLIINMDNKANDDYGQRTGQAILDSDFFLKNNFSQKSDIKRKVERFFGLIHGLNGLTPTLNEKGMYAAFSTSLQSACLSRQVGAALFDDEGNLLAVGKNDVPKAGGGLYSSDDFENDHRCVHKSGKCYNDANKLKIKERINNTLSRELNSIFQNTVQTGATTDINITRLMNSIDNIAEEIYKESKISIIMEYSRSIHAEMDVITTMARKSTDSTKGKILYTTTYPCHNCARHIVAAGIKKVIYIEPFDKSLALDLHNDAITKNNESSMVIFSDFEGVSPRRYNKFFRPTDERKDPNTGHAKKFNTKYNNHIDVQYLDDYRKYESAVAKKFISEVAKIESDI